MELKKIATTIPSIDANTQEEIVHNVVVTLFLGRQSLSLATRLSKLLIPLVSVMGGQNVSPGKDLSLMEISFTPEIIDTLVKNLLMALDDQKISILVLDLCKNVEVDGQTCSKPELFDLVFQGEFALMFKVLKLVIIENFTPFLKTQQGAEGAELLLKKIMNLGKK